MGKSFFYFLERKDEPGIKEILTITRNKKKLEKQIEVRFVNSQGNIIWGLLKIIGIKSVEKKTFQWIIQIHESTTRKKSEEIIKNLNLDLQHKNREMEQLVYITSHDLRSPLVNIQGFAGELKISFSELTNLIETTANPEILDAIELHKKNIDESFGYIHISIQKMDKLLKGLLEFSRLGKKIRTPGRIIMNNLIADVLNTHEYIIKNSGINLDLSGLPDCWGSEEMINQAFSNLIGNAVKYIDPCRKGYIKISGSTQDRYSVYCIEDNGKGILPKHQTKIFELFYRICPENGEGEGLGLPAVKKILELSRGKIELESEWGKGSKFYIWLPMKEKADLG
jgi:signal transduction histidine kinase